MATAKHKPSQYVDEAVLAVDTHLVATAGRGSALGRAILAETGPPAVGDVVTPEV